MLAPRRAGLAAAALLTLAVGAASGEPVGIAPWLTGALLPPRERAAGHPLLLEVQDFYARRALRPAWTDAHGTLTREGRAAADVLAGAVAHGFPAERYAIEAGDGAERDVRLTYQLVRYARDLEGGRWPAREPMVLWRRPPATGASSLEAVLRDPRGVERLAPRHAQYVALRHAHARYRRLAAQGGWAALPPRLRAGRGATGAWLPGLVERLAREGDLRGLPSPGRLDGVVAEGLRRFQARHGLPATGTLDAATVLAWNVPVEARLRQLEINLERWRWLPRDLGREHLLVNVPTFDLHAVRGGQAVLRMKVVTGAQATPTPVFSTRASAVVFRPWWNVPASIAEGELLPLLRRDPGALARRGILRTGSALRQRPGPGNALGLVKVALEDTPGVYLHDTPQDALFARSSRAFSHGCIRLEKPEQLARLLVGDAGWDDRRVRAAMAQGPERAVPLPAPWAVHIVYFTAWVEDDGAVRFLPDVYGHDGLQGRVLWGPGAGPPAPERPRA